ncbi:Os06g0619400 [Oryza sativa Japonica Group]|uniref:Os06g0619400 protein n=2 Tax=Oryza sativa subsp. japonica TaxID=39947 RepID=Q69XP3_ORYSJ|nr:hypothetical protein [Oryza sativa Japonica Group]BAS98647.1 Os06g0619400 [Oryza sativa Japonica Group]
MESWRHQIWPSNTATVGVRHEQPHHPTERRGRRKRCNDATGEAGRRRLRLRTEATLPSHLACRHGSVNPYLLLATPSLPAAMMALQTTACPSRVSSSHIKLDFLTNSDRCVLPPYLR